MMSILHFNAENNLWIISHQQFLNDCYQMKDQDTSVKNIFNVLTPFRMDLEAQALANRLETGSRKRNRKRKNQDCHKPKGVDPKEISFIKEKYKNFLENNKYHLFPGSPSLTEIRENNSPLRELVKDILNNIEEEYDPNQMQRGDNPSSTPQIHGDIILPPKCNFLTTDVSSLNTFQDQVFDTIVMDPPWENKHVKRKKHSSLGYTMMANEEIGELPVGQLLEDAGLVFVWCSNCKRHRDSVLDWFQKWKVKLIAKWFWLKVTKYGETICEFSEGTGKQPYEIIFIGEKSGVKSEGDSRREIPEDAVIISTPSGIHSHKPPLCQIIDQFEDTNKARNKLEIFGRSLLPGWTTIGNEATKLQSLHLFDLAK